MAGAPLHTSTLTLTVERYVDGFVVKCVPLATNGYGPTVVGALEDLAESLAYQVDAWTDAPAPSAGMAEARAFYRTLEGD